MKAKNRIFAVAAVILLVLPVMLTMFSVGSGAESLYIRKIVSLVYDDSGSMSPDDLANANYALQSFCGMLNSEDRLFVTYMYKAEASSTYQPEEMVLTPDGIQTTVESIRDHNSSGSTPYEAVTRAYNKLKSVNDPNPNTQYWLVVLTDGTFNNSGSTETEKKNFLNNNFLDYTDDVMPNGTNPQITFLGIGGDAVLPDEDQERGIYTYFSPDSESIIATMSQLASRISGRTGLKKTDIIQVSANTVKISSAIPLLNIALFSQKSNAKVTSVTHSNGSSIPITRHASLSYNSNYPDLVSESYLFGDSQTVIKEGSYNIVFDSAVDVANLDILYEPALEMRMAVKVNGKEIANHSDLQNLYAGDKISVSCKVYEMGTNNQIGASLLPPGTSYKLTVRENGSETLNVGSSDMKFDDYVLKNIATEIKAELKIEGFNPITYAISFTPTKPPEIYTVGAELENSISSVKYDDIDQNTDLRVIFTVMLNGVPMTDPEAVKALNPNVSVSPSSNGGNVSYSADGKVIFTPNAADAEAIKNGDYKVDVTCTISGGKSATASYTVVATKYTLVADYVGDASSIRYEDIKSNTDKGISFTLFADGAEVKDPERVKALNPRVTVSPSSNSGSVSYSADGKIIFIPNTADSEAAKLGSFDVSVSCSVDGGASATKSYTVSVTKYTLSWDYTSNVTSIKYDGIASNNSLKLCFTVLADGAPVTDPERVKALAPTFTLSPEGNDGTFEFSDDGKIIFTPNKASERTGESAEMNVDVRCTLDGGASTVASYTVIHPEYAIVVIPSDISVKKTEMFGNTAGVSFYVTKDGERLGKTDVENDISIALADAESERKYNITVADDGTVTLTPYSEDKYEMIWPINWLNYFTCDGDDVVFDINYKVLTKSATLDVIDESVPYILLNVALPLFIEVAIIAFLLWWAYAIVGKPKFNPDVSIYVGSIDYGGEIGARYHRIRDVEEIVLSRYNKLKYRWKPTLKPTVVNISGDLYVSARYNGTIACECKVWYSGPIEPNSSIGVKLNNPTVLMRYIEKNRFLKIKVLSTYDASKVQEVMYIDEPRPQKYYVQTENCTKVDGVEVIKSGYIFAYAQRSFD